MTTCPGSEEKEREGVGRFAEDTLPKYADLLRARDRAEIAPVLSREELGETRDYAERSYEEGEDQDALYWDNGEILNLLDHIDHQHTALLRIKSILESHDPPHMSLSRVHEIVKEALG